MLDWVLNAPLDCTPSPKVRTSIAAELNTQDCVITQTHRQLFKNLVECYILFQGILIKKLNWALENFKKTQTHACVIITRSTLSKKVLVEGTYQSILLLTLSRTETIGLKTAALYKRELRLTCTQLSLV